MRYVILLNEMSHLAKKVCLRKSHQISYQMKCAILLNEMLHLIKQIFKNFSLTINDKKFYLLLIERPYYYKYFFSKKNGITSLISQKASWRPFCFKTTNLSISVTIKDTIMALYMLTHMDCNSIHVQGCMHNNYLKAHIEYFKGNRLSLLHSVCYNSGKV